jgi:DNA helicase-4
VFNPRRDLEPIIAFLKHFKTNNMTLEMVNARAVNYKDILRAKSFLKVFEAVYKGYQEDLVKADEIDFEDLIHLACEKIEQGEYKSDYDYIMVDEFQDASQDRLRLIKALAGQRKHIKLFAVGDDWQSIYRFSGADIQVMKTFPGMFGFTEDLELTHTFRSAQEIIDVASEFVQRNPDQFKKNVKATFSNGKDSVILKPYDPNHPDQILESLLGSLEKRALQENSKLSVFILTRYIAQEPDNLTMLIDRHPNLQIQWKTIHGSKGLEADCVIIHHLNGGSSGFPCEINDDPILDLVIPNNETFPHAEERRLLYVAITRAKKLVYGFYHPRSPSTFIKELSEIPGVKVHDPRFAPLVEAGNACPCCKTGVMKAIWVENTIKLICSRSDECGHSIEIRCPDCKVGVILPKKANHTGRTFFGCNQFPTCKHIYKESITYTGRGFRPF